MRISFDSKQDRECMVEFDKSSHSLYPSELVDVDTKDLQNADIRIKTVASKMNAWMVVLLFFERLVLNIFNIFIMNITWKWTEDLDPFTITASFQTDNSNTKIYYKPGKLQTKPFKIDLPSVLVNNEPIKFTAQTDHCAVNRAFLKHCFDVVSLMLYYLILITLIFIYSGLFSKLLGVYIAFLCIAIIPATIKCLKTYKEKKLVLKRLLKDV